MNFKKLNEIAKSKGKHLLVENLSIIGNQYKVDKPTLKESVISHSGGQFQCRAIIRDVPVSRYVENQNNRIYPRPLWQKICNEKTAERTFCHANHPEDDGDVLLYCGVWHNFRMGNETPIADLYLIGDAGELLLEAMLAGGKVHFSSVGYGEFEEDSYGNETNVVMSESFELVRLGDWVAESSQNVYATLENNDYTPVKKESKENTFTNKVSDYSNTFIESNLNQSEKEIEFENEKEITNKKGANIMDMKEKKFWENTTKSLLRDLRKEESLVTIQKDLADHLETLPLEFTDLREKVSAEIEKVTAKLEENLSAKDKQISETKDEKELLEGKLIAATETLEDLKEKYNSAKDVIKKLQEGKLKESDEVISVFQENEKYMKSDIETLMEDRNTAISDVEKLIEEIEKRDSDLKAFIEDRELMESDLKQLVEDRKTMQSDIVELLEQLEKVTADMKEMQSMRAGDYANEMEEEDEIYGPSEIEEQGDYDYDNIQNYAATGSYYVAEEGDEMEPEMTEEEMDEPESEIEEMKKRMAAMRHRESRVRKPARTLKRESARKVAPKRPVAEKAIKSVKPEHSDFQSDLVKDFFEKKVKEYGARLEPLREHLFGFDNVVKADLAIERYLEESESKGLGQKFQEAVADNFRNSEIFLNR